MVGEKKPNQKHANTNTNESVQLLINETVVKRILFCLGIMYTYAQGENTEIKESAVC
jgi:hypothetical protein